MTKLSIRDKILTLFTSIAIVSGAGLYLVPNLLTAFLFLFSLCLLLIVIKDIAQKKHALFY